MGERTEKLGKALRFAACTLGAYHCLYALLARQLLLPRWALYVDYLLVLVLAAVVIVCGAAAIFQKAVRGPAGEAISRYNNWCSFLLILLFLLFCVSALLAERTAPGSLRENRGCLFDAAISFFVLFPLGFWYGSRGDYRFLTGLIDLLTAIYTGILLYGLWGVYTPGDVYITGMPVFMHRGQLYLGCNPNTTGMLCALFMMTGLYRILSGGKGAGILYGAAEIVLYTGLSLSNSRGGAIALSLGLGGAAGVLVWFRCEGRGTRQKWLRAAVATVLAVLAVWYGRWLACATVPPGEAGEGFAAAARGLLTKGGSEKGSGRLLLWETILSEVLTDHGSYLLQGCSPYSISTVLSDYGYAMYTHNQILEVVMGYGLPAALVFVAWLCLAALRSWRMGTAPLGSVSAGRRVLPLILLLLVTNNMFEASLLFYRYITGSLFFLVAGYVCAASPGTRLSAYAREKR